jgi:hypothetical protein
MHLKRRVVLRDFLQQEAESHPPEHGEESLTIQGCSIDSRVGLDTLNSADPRHTVRRIRSLLLNQDEEMSRLSIQ